MVPCFPAPRGVAPMIRLIPRVSRTHLLLAAAISLVAVLPASATVLHYHATGPAVFGLGGQNETPANASPGSGTAEITIDDVANTMRVQAFFSGLNGTTTACHIHGPTATANTGTAGVAT